MAFQKLIELDRLADQQGTEFMVDGRVVAVFRQGQSVYAVDGMCAHQGGPLAQGQLDDKCITCPWHGWQYDVSSGCNSLTGKQLLERFPTEIRGREVWIDVAPE